MRTTRTLAAVAGLAGAAWVSAQTTQPTLQLQSPPAEVGKAFTFEVKLASAEEVGGINARVVLPADMTVSAVEGLQGLTSAYRQDGTSLFLLAYSAASPFSGTDVLLRVTAQVSETATAGSRPLAFADTSSNPAFVNTAHAVSNRDGTTSLAHGVSGASLLVYTQTSDADGDGLPDAWEILYNLNPGASNAAADPDGDGFSNLQEFQAKTNPTDPASRPTTSEPVAEPLKVSPIVRIISTKIMLDAQRPAATGDGAEPAEQQAD